MTDVLAMRWEEAIDRLHQSGVRIAGLEVTRPTRSEAAEKGPLRVVRQVEFEPGFALLTLAYESGYRGKPLIAQ
ncbi:MAG: hypothetical protein HY318_10910 [Armatimonadetes bacterium]|nr:hypothetical protein [Armatimonadota bacterium]